MLSIDHIGFTVSDFKRSRAFYVAALAPLGLKIINEAEGWAIMSRTGTAQLWFGLDQNSVTSPLHIAFAADNRELVHAFHDAALKAGGKDNGGPGLRPQYHPHYYGAFVIDPDGHNIEAVCHQPA